MLDSKSVLDTRESFIAIFVNYINSGKDTGDKIVKKTLDNIRTQEGKLKEAGIAFEEFDPNNHDKYLKVSNIPDELTPVHQETEKYINSAERNLILETENTVGGFKKVKKRETIKRENISIILEPKVEKIIEDETKNKNIKANALINEALDDIFDRNTKTFKIDIPVMNKQDKRTTTYLVDCDIIKALKEQAKLRNMSISAYFNALLEKCSQE